MYASPNERIQAKKIPSVIAVHGLGGHPFKTWQHPNGKVWLADFLPAQLPEARVMTYGYNSSVLFSKSVAGIDDFATDLLFRISMERRCAAVSRPLLWNHP